MVARISVLVMSLCILCGAAFAAQPTDRKAAREQKAQERAQKKSIKAEIRYYESLRNEAVAEFAKKHQPASIETPGMGNEIRVSDIVCAGDNISGTVVLHLQVTPTFGPFRLFMGGKNNGTQALAKGISYPSSDTYGRIYTLRSGQPEPVIVMFYDIAPGVERLDRVDISMGLALSALNIITLKDVPIIWTYSNKAISNYLRKPETKKSAN
uniref:hypothetical protein n=1 Tax=Alistipes sp. D31t1_170403_E11 TaxID=2787128 RepID=UPI00189A190D|nr:hypothetical protein [Alistipes sp. D31t1_170403_E11]